MWAAQKLGLTGAHADSYAISLVMSELDTGKHEVARKIRKDFEDKGVAVSDDQIASTINELIAKAIADVKAGR